MITKIGVCYLPNSEQDDSDYPQRVLVLLVFVYRSTIPPPFSNHPPMLRLDQKHKSDKKPRNKSSYVSIVVYIWQYSHPQIQSNEEQQNCKCGKLENKIKKRGRSTSMTE